VWTLLRTNLTPTQTDGKANIQRHKPHAISIKVDYEKQFLRSDVRLLLNFTDAPQTVTVGTASHTLPPRDLILYR
jgi:hypothetical protein